MEILSQVWVWIGTALGGVTLAGIITAIIYGCLRGAFNKAINKIDTEKISNKAVDKGIEKVRTITFNHSIQPLLESGLQKVNENANKYIQEQMGKCQEQYDKLINILENLSAYFDNSIGVSTEAKEKLHSAIKEAKNEQIMVESNLGGENVKDEPVIVVEEPKTAKNNTKSTKVER